MTVNDAMRLLLQIFPDCEVGSDNDGQLVVYTGCKIDGDTLVPFSPEEACGE
jgi:hypothetical protein